MAVLTAACTFGQSKAGGQGGELPDTIGTTTSSGADDDDDDSGEDGIPNPTATETGTDGEGDDDDDTDGCLIPAPLGCPCLGDEDCVEGTVCVDDVCAGPNCGDGVLDPGEDCDDGNPISDDGCDNDCRLSQGVAQVVGGAQHTCARTHDGTVKCWGEGAAGRLGLGNPDDIGLTNTPADNGFVDAGGFVVDICTGADFTCVALEDGDARCWGDAGQGKLGSNSNQDIGDNEVPADTDPIEIGGSVVAIGCGTQHACAVFGNGDVRCWGVHNSGRLGNLVNENIGDNEHPNEEAVVDVGGDAVDVVAGNEHTCALLDDGAVRCWGRASLGRLGNGDPMENIGDNEPPSAIGPVALGAGAIQLAAGAEHTCALLDDGSIRCWGEAGKGQLGNGDTSEDIGDDETPDMVPALPLPPAIHIGAGAEHTCAVLATNEVTCWGEGADGRLGNESDVDVTTPTGEPVNLGLDVRVVSVGAGTGHTCARVGGGALICFGVNTSGQLGYGNGNQPIGDDEPPVTAGAVPF